MEASHKTHRPHIKVGKDEEKKERFREVVREWFRKRGQRVHVVGRCTCFGLARRLLPVVILYNSLELLAEEILL